MPFRAILETLVHGNTPAVRGAIFCDHEGERVDAVCGDVDAFTLDVTGATFAATAATMVRGQRMRVAVGDEVLWIVMVEEGYYLVVFCRPGLDMTCKSVFPSIADALAAYM